MYWWVPLQRNGCPYAFRHTCYFVRKFPGSKNLSSFGHSPRNLALNSSGLFPHSGRASFEPQGSCHHCIPVLFAVVSKQTMANRPVVIRGP